MKFILNKKEINIEGNNDKKIIANKLLQFV